MFSRRCQIVTTVAVSLFLVGFNVILYQKQPVPSTTNKRQHRSFNLLEDVAHPPSTAVLGDECTLDYINDHRLPQNHPCVIETIRQDYLNQPAADEEPLVLRQPNKADQSVGQAPAILRHLNNKVLYNY